LKRQERFTESTKNGFDIVLSFFDFQTNMPKALLVLNYSLSPAACRL
jgi:hypothetical protein